MMTKIIGKLNMWFT